MRNVGMYSSSVSRKKVDMGEVLKYPLTPIPLSLCHVDGTMLNTPKSKLLQYMESQVETIA